ncbi:uncharacterized protein SPSC_01675 [Sporisorium scitamineum]|uniref:Peptidase C15, pyroglutamyl peptidase I-like protein n=1 Tax=Sporisorium scitamineum TaxID=49012 RepID=A0A0F7RVI0_9BASI|nr:hypothetical protein [Sporisorium scitamineum]CDU23045.1 uncharacterized protein SPSC_01675 [Sporisorium scitamineum]
MAPTHRVAPRELDILITGFGPFMSVGNNPSWLAVKPLHDTVLDLSTAPTLSTTRDDKVANGDDDGGSGFKGRIQAMQIPVHYGSVLDVVPRIHGCEPGAPEARFWYDSRLDRDFGGKPRGVYPEAYPVEPPVSKSWDVVIHVGVGRQGSLRCETQAHKLGYGKPDANGEYAPLTDSTANVLPKHLDKDGAIRGFSTAYETFTELESTRIPVSELVSWLKERGMEGDEVDQSFDPGRYLCDFICYCSLCEAKRSGKGTLVLFVHVPPAGERLEVERCTEAIRAIAWFMANKRRASTA